MRCALSDERTGLPFAFAAGPRQGCHFRARVPWDSRPYFTVSHLRLPFLSPSTTRSYGGGIRPRLHTGLMWCSCNRPSLYSRSMHHIVDNFFHYCMDSYIKQLPSNKSQRFRVEARSNTSTIALRVVDKVKIKLSLCLTN
jgi:hypothetical protein